MIQPCFQLWRSFTTDLGIYSQHRKSEYGPQVEALGFVGAAGVSIPRHLQPQAEAKAAVGLKPVSSRTPLGGGDEALGVGGPNRNRRGFERELYPLALAIIAGGISDRAEGWRAQGDSYTE